MFEIHLGNSVNCVSGWLIVVEHWHSVIYEYISVWIVLVWVSFLNMEFDCKSNSLNCGKFALRILFSPPPSRLFYRYWCDWFRRGTRVVGFSSLPLDNPRYILLYRFRVGLMVGIRMRYFCCIIFWPDCVLWFYLETCFILLVVWIKLLIAL